MVVHFLQIMMPATARLSRFMLKLHLERWASTILWLLLPFEGIVQGVNTSLSAIGLSVPDPVGSSIWKACWTSSKLGAGKAGFPPTLLWLVLPFAADLLLILTALLFPSANPFSPSARSIPLIFPLSCFSSFSAVMRRNGFNASLLCFGANPTLAERLPE